MSLLLPLLFGFVNRLSQANATVIAFPPSPTPGPWNSLPAESPALTGFRRLGRTVAGLSYAHIQVPVDLQKALTLAENLVGAIDGTYNETATPMNSVRILQLQQATSARDRVQTLISMTTPLFPLHRTRRNGDVEWLDSHLQSAARKVASPENLTMGGNTELTTHEVNVLCAGLRAQIQLRGAATDAVSYPTLDYPQQEGKESVRQPGDWLVERATSYSLQGITSHLADQAKLIQYILRKLAVQNTVNAAPSRTELLLLARCPQDFIDTSFLPGWEHPMARLTRQQQDSPPRNPRSPLLGAAVGLGVASTAGATIFGVFNYIALSQMQQQVEQHHQQIGTIILQIDELGMVVSTQGKAISQLQKVVLNQQQMTRALQSELHASQLIAAWVSAVTAMVDDLTAIVNSALQHRLHVHAVPEVRLQEALLNVTRHADLLGFKTLPTTVSDILQCETSFLHTTAGLSLLVHLPIYTVELDLYQHLELNAEVEEDVFVSFRPPQEVLALNADATLFHVSTMADLAHCTKAGETFLCKGLQVLRKSANLEEDDTYACLLHLFRNDYVRANSSCPLYISPARDAAVALPGNRILLSARKPHSGMVMCADGRSNQFQVQHLSQVSLSPSCRMETGSWSATALEDFTVETQSFTFGWNGRLKDLLGDFDLTAYKVLAALPSLIPVPTEVRSAAAWTKMKQDRDTFSFMSYKIDTTAGWGIGMGTLATILVCVGLGVWCWRSRHRRMAPLTLASAPNRIQAVNFSKGEEGVRFLQVA